MENNKYIYTEDFRVSPLPVEPGKISGIMSAMRTTIDTAGRLVIPKEIRREAGLRPGTPLDVRWKEGCIEITPAPLPVKLVRRGRLLVAVPEKEIGPLTTDAVERTRKALRRNQSPHT